MVGILEYVDVYTLPKVLDLPVLPHFRSDWGRKKSEHESM